MSSETLLSNLTSISPGSTLISSTKYSSSSRGRFVTTTRQRLNPGMEENNPPLEDLKLNIHKTASLAHIGHRTVREYRSEFILPNDMAVGVTRMETYLPSEDHQEVLVSLSTGSPWEDKTQATDTAVGQRRLLCIRDYLDQDAWARHMLRADASVESSLMQLLKQEWEEDPNSYDIQAFPPPAQQQASSSSRTIPVRQDSTHSVKELMESIKHTLTAGKKPAEEKRSSPGKQQAGDSHDDTTNASAASYVVVRQSSLKLKDDAKPISSRTVREQNSSVVQSQRVEQHSSPVKPPPPPLTATSKDTSGRSAPKATPEVIPFVDSDDDHAEMSHSSATRSATSEQQTSLSKSMQYFLPEWKKSSSELHDQDLPSQSILDPAETESSAPSSSSSEESSLSEVEEPPMEKKERKKPAPTTFKVSEAEASKQTNTHIRTHTHPHTICQK